MKQANKVCWSKKSKDFLKSKLTPELAEFIGIMLGDGYLSYPRNPRIKISFNSEDDKEYLCFVRELLTKLFSTKIKTEHRKNEKTSNLYIFNIKLLRYLMNDIGLKSSPKWNLAEIPEWIFKKKLEKHVLRGYFDTDGCVVITDNNGTRYPRLEMKICPSPMQKQFISILYNYQFKFGVYDIGKGKVRIQMNGRKQLKKWMSIVGFHNNKHQIKANSF
ncbi:MAG: hypothetical protein KKF46_00685 [Nanoarchaeota archaeon]|nr:hypothetical protein [Nanoarchaeota archaeon]MBU1320849.1 hypothetical protein [Nanoarchaeota archaeon]MBU1596947.1 hypothetical protein [Nanoarchaeota archaeon]MBU2440762.1 hypothetical protein [Nanoarchaeota archaeon]